MQSDLRCFDELVDEFAAILEETPERRVGAGKAKQLKGMREALATLEGAVMSGNREAAGPPAATLLIQFLVLSAMCELTPGDSARLMLGEG